MSFSEEIAMKRVLLIAVVAAILDATSAAAAELPTFELTGFPITPHQVAVVGSTNVEEHSTIPTLMLGGMPASPHQVAVLTPRPRTAKQASIVNATTFDLSAR
jgi:molybdopterin biosynthesis enzyme